MSAEVPQAQLEIDALRANAASPEQLAEADAKQAELDAERAAALAGLGSKVTEYAVQQDGTVVPKHEIEEARVRGEEVTAVYKGGSR